MHTRYISLGILYLLATLSKVEGACDPAFEFECANGRCVEGIFICDGGNDCGDGSDETDPCPACPLKYMTCKTGTDTRCVYGEWMCDGAWNCEDGSDERDEFGKCPPCPEAMFQCNSGKCTHAEYICDGENDCKDKSDEVDPVTGECPTCLRGMFSCRTERTGCIFPWDMCGGMYDCTDRSDEEYCGCENKTKGPARPMLSKKDRFNRPNLVARTFPKKIHR